jgi:hypothetical protein
VGIFRDILTKQFIGMLEKHFLGKREKEDAILNIAERIWAKSIWQTDYFFCSKPHQTLQTCNL